MTTADPSPASTYEAVLRLTADYARFLDERDAESWTALFVPDGGIVFGPRQITGADALRKFLDRTPRGVHIPGVPSITNEGDEVTCTSSTMFLDSDTGVIRGVVNEDRMTWHDGQLLFVQRAIEMKAQVG